MFPYVKNEHCYNAWWINSNIKFGRLPFSFKAANISGTVAGEAGSTGNGMEYQTGTKTCIPISGHITETASQVTSISSILPGMPYRANSAVVNCPEL